MDYKNDGNLDSGMPDYPEPRIFKPLMPEAVEEFLQNHTIPAEPEEEPPRNLRRRLAWIRERRERKFRGTRTRQQQNRGTDWSGADINN